ncbi:alpha/beta hydrolase fold protein [Methanolacinia petrolearia DSM 11571]|uniref:Alpha/beta hydrolase fold protein n=1 Tax=Methanolacinia petrolearia (strain DSM 11571 / OCM 486 / SEBR 4847) TaxID=679926 RepID=E1RF29_METP4|nr:alpha/beta hydrolase [Methanolacinia petrolearia]ADN37273.1 alpha/beta hydrolase fold protein [Methanolacinia petrolearia DSM 11571]
MADFVFVHGGNMDTATWNGLTTGEEVFTEDGKMGGEIWDGTVSFLRDQGHRAFAPTLAGEYSCNLSGHIREICVLLAENNLHDVILVGHSYGGMVITGVAARIPENVGRLVYVDAALPDSGQSLYDLIESAGIDAGSFSGLEPAPPYVEKLFFDPSKIRAIPKTYILCTKSDFVSVTGVARRKIEADPDGWEYFELPASHVPMADMPAEFYGLIGDLIQSPGE